MKPTLIFMGSILLILLVACEFSPEPAEPEGNLPARVDLPTPPPCADDSGPPEQVYPAEGDVVLDLQPEFVWTFSFECQPLGFMLRVGTRVDPQSDDVFNGDTEGPFTTYSGVELLPATWHRWRVYAHLTEGHYVGIGRAGEFVSFLTGPMCEAEQLAAPELIYPADGSIYTGKSWGNPYEVEATISYPGGTCLPDSFVIYISETEDFSTENLNVYNPGMNFSTNDAGDILNQDDSNDVPDCTILYWKAWAKANGSDGPESETHHFFADIEGNCIVPLLVRAVPYIKAPQDTNCRASDYTASKNIGTLKKDEEAEVLAVNPEGTHVFIEEPSTRVRCWVWLGLVDLMKGDMPLDPTLLRELVSIQDPPAQPTDTPTLVPSTTPEPAALAPQCSDGIDNDGDGRIDYKPIDPIKKQGTGDPQCTSLRDDNEAN